MFEISAVIATYNREKYLEKALNSLLIQTLDNDKFEVIVVDNNCTDNTSKLCEKFHKENPHIHYKYFVEKNQGLSYGRNCGIKESNARYITFVDDDAYLDPNFLQCSIDWMNSNPEVGAIGGKILLHYEAKPPKWITPFLAPLFGYFVWGNEPKSFKRPKFPKGSNMTFRSAVFDEVGLFNPELGRVKRNLGAGEEKELFDRIYDSGAKVHYVPNAIVHHYVPEERTKTDFIKRQAEGTGRSEWFRVSFEGKSSIRTRIIQELIKWIGSLILLFFYLVIFRPSKGIMIFKFRYWVTRGFLEQRKQK